MNKAFLYLHICVLLAGLTGVFGKVITLDAFFLTWYRVLISGILLFLIFKTIRKKETIQLLGSDGKIALNGILLSLHWVLFYASIKYSNISVGVLCFCLTGFFTALLQPLFNRKKFSFIELALSILNVIGISTIFHFDSSFRTGIILGVISAIIVAVFTIFNERLIKNNDVIKTTTLQMLGGLTGLSVLLLVYLPIMKTGFVVPNFHDFVYLFILASLCTVTTYLLLNTALKYISAFTVNLSFNLEPIYSILIAVAFFGESKQLTGSFFAGLSLILLSLALQTVRVIMINNKNRRLMYNSAAKSTSE